jgi:hypothetical protein
MCIYNEADYGTMNLADPVGPLLTVQNGGLLLVGLLTAVVVWFVGAERLVRLPLVAAKRLVAFGAPPEPQARSRAPN